VTARQLTLNGYDFSSDSYHSADPAKTGALGNVWSQAGILNSVGAANVFLWGKLTTGSFYALEIGPESSIGSVAWHDSGNRGIEPGYLETTSVWGLPDVILPFTTWLQPAQGTVDGEHYSFLLATGDYRLNSLNLAGNEKLLVTGAARLYVPDELDLKGTAAIRILPGASLRLYVAAGTANIRGTGILNEGVPAQFVYYGLGPNKTLNLRLTTAFAGLIYAPQAVCYITAKGNTPGEMNGAVVVQELALGSALRVRYDEALNATSTAR
jgi:hypothetical protein